MMQSLFYKARTSGNMWDTWLYAHTGVFYLFHLAKSAEHWYGIAMATSADGVNWHEHGLVLEKAPGVSWLGTGSVWPAPAGTTGGKPRWILNFSEWRGTGQTIFFAESADLLHWHRLDDSHEFRPDDRWYNTGGGNTGRWDCIYTIPRPGGGFYGYWTANPLEFSGFGFGESLDGVTWRALPPPRIEWGTTTPLPVIESGAVAEIGGRFYTMLGSYQEYGPYASGMFAFVADAPAGPFRPIPTNFALLTSPKGRWHSYFTRFFEVGGERLVNHHAIAPDGEVWFAPLKKAVVDEAGVLRLKWWPGNAAIKHAWQARDERVANGPLTYTPAAGMLVEGTLSFPPDTTAAQPPQIAVGWGTGNEATRFLVEAGGTVTIDTVTADGTVQPLEGIDRTLHLAGSVPFRLLVMHGFVELYLDDHLIQLHALPGPASGHVTLTGSATNVQCWQNPEVCS